MNSTGEIASSGRSRRAFHGVTTALYQIYKTILSVIKTNSPKGGKLHNLTVLDNGLEVVTARVDSARSVTVGVFVRAGSRQEKDGEFGVSHFLEHMMFKGTRKRPTSKHIAEAVEGVGGIFNAEASKELTVFWAKMASHHLSLALDVIADIILNSVYDPKEMQKERHIIVEESETRRANGFIYWLTKRYGANKHSAGMSVVQQRACLG